MPLGPTVRRRRLGAELRRLREAQSLKLEEVAEQLDLAASTLSRIETGKAPTKTAYLTAMLKLYGVEDPGARKVLVDMAREGHRKGWWSSYDDVLPSGFDIYVGLEAEASGLRSYESDVVHGLLQTTDYALAVLREVRPRDSDEFLQRGVELRIKRQQALDHDPPLDLWIILDESAVRRNIGGPAVMRRQLQHLIEASRWSNVTLQVLAFDAGAHAGLTGPFSILEFPERSDPDVAYTESLGGMIYLEKDRDVRACAEAFDRMRASALSPAASVELIQRAAEELTDQVLLQNRSLWKDTQMDTDPTAPASLHWFKSSASSAAGCVEIAHLPEGGVAVRDSKDRSKAPHVFNRHEWECFLIGARKGEFDLPVG